MHTSDDAMITRVLGGDTEAYGDLISRHQSEVWRIAAAMLDDAAATEDLVQQTFVRAYQQLHRFERGRDFSHWLKGIARNLVRDELRKRSRERHRLEHHWMALESELGRDDAEAEEQRRLMMDALERCTRKLPEPAGRIVELRYQLALGFEEIAARLGRTVPASRQLLARTRLLLRDCVRKELARP